MSVQFEISLTPPEHVSQKRTCRHWEDLETWLSVATDSLLPKAAETLKHQTQDQLNDNITSLTGQDPSQSYSHKELAKITGSLSHTLITTLKFSDKHAAQLQQELTQAQRHIEQLELEAQKRQERTDEVYQGAEEEINRLKALLSEKWNKSKKTTLIVLTSYSMQSSYWRRQRLTLGTKTAESKPLKLNWMSQETRSAT